MDKDEHYIIDLCDEVLSAKAERQHRVPFLQGDPNSEGKRARLPIDAFYEVLGLAIEYREVQHSQPVAMMDARPTVSGVDRGEQRRIYDQRRRDVLPAHGITVVELDYSMFPHDSRKKLKRNRDTDTAIIRDALRSKGVQV